METSPNGSNRLRFGAFETDLSAGRLFKNGLPVHIQDQPFQILKMLLVNPGELVSREQIQAQLWPNGTFVDFDESLNTAIKKLRYALGDSAPRPLYIETVPRRGYRFIAPFSEDGAAKKAFDPAIPEVVRTLIANSSAEGLLTVGGKSEEGHIQSDPIHPFKWQRLLKTMAVVALVLAAAGFGIFVWLWHGRGAGTESLAISRLTDNGLAAQAAISPDGHYFVYAKHELNGYGLWVRQVSTGNEIQILSADIVDLEGLSFSPNGDYIYFVRGVKDDTGLRYLYSISILGGSPTLLIKDIDSPLTFSPDGRHFFFTRGVSAKADIELRIANADGSDDTLLARVHHASVAYQLGGSWSPDGRAISISVLHLGRNAYFGLAIASVADGTVREIYTNSFAIGRPMWFLKPTRLLTTLEDRTGHGQLWTISYPNGRPSRLTNDLSDYSLRIDLTRDEQQLVTTVRRIDSQIWIAHEQNLMGAAQITSGTLAMFSPVPDSKGRILAVSQDGRLWVLDEQGHRTQFTDVLNISFPISCGPYVVFDSYRSGSTELMRVGENGLGATELARGSFDNPVCEPGGTAVFYREFGPPHRIWRSPLDGGKPVEVAEVLGNGVMGHLCISPDGKLLADTYEEDTPLPTTKLALVSATEGSVSTVKTVPSGEFGFGPMHWSPDGKSLQTVLFRNGADNIWQLPLNGGQAEQVTRFSTGQIFDFTWTLDHKRLLLSRGEVSSDVVLLSNLH